MDITRKIINQDGKEVVVKVQAPSINQILTAIEERGVFKGIARYPFTSYDIEQALKIVEAIGKSRNPKFVIDDENRFTYENFIKWCHCDSSMMCLDPTTLTPIQGRLKKGIYIAGNTGSGKSWCLEIMREYCRAWRFAVKLPDETSPSPLWWRIVRADYLCDVFAETGSIKDFKDQPIIGIQDLEQEPQETLYMGNRLEVVRNLIEYRGDKSDELTLITSNLRINGENLSQRYGDRVASRLIEMCNYFEIKGKDRRKF